MKNCDNEIVKKRKLRSEPPGQEGKVGKKLRNEMKILQDRAQITDLLLKGTRLYDIAKIVGIGYNLLRYDIAAIEKQWKENAIYNFDEAKQKMIERWEHLYRTYWEAWDKSVNEPRTKEEKRHAVRGRKVKVVKLIAKNTTEEQAFGDSRYMQGCERCLLILCKLYGMIETAGHKVEDAIAAIPGSPQASFIIMPTIMAPKAPPKDITPAQIDLPK